MKYSSSLKSTKQFIGYTKDQIQVAKYFALLQNKNKRPIINKVEIYTSCKTPNATFNLELLENRDGVPGSSLYDDILIGKADEGKGTSIVNIADLEFRYPINGLFVAFEWLPILSNEFEFSYHRGNVNERYTKLTLEPSIGVYPSDYVDTFVLEDDIWRKYETQSNILDEFKNKFQSLAIQLVLSE